MTSAMSETDPSSLLPAGIGGGPRSAALPSGGRSAIICFSRDELDEIFGLYGQMVAVGEWRDYAIDMLRDRAVFSVFRRSSERPVYVIEKRPELARKQGAYSVVAMTGAILRRGHDLARVLRVLRPKPRVIRS